MGAILTIDVESADVDQFFTDLTQRANSPEAFLGYVGSDMKANFRANIDAESGGPDFGGPYPPLKPATVAERERLGYGGSHPILKRTLALYGALTSQVTGPESVSAGIDGSLPYPAAHDVGDGQEQRSFVWIDDARVEGWLEILAQNLVEGIPIPAVAA